MLFDPTVDLQAQTAQARQARVYADLLRKQAMSAQAPQGQMVSGHFVAPHWTQQLGPVLEQLSARLQGGIADKAEQQLAQRQTQMAQDWHANMPAATPATPGVPGYGANEMDNEPVPAVPPTPYKPVPLNSRLRHTLAGLQNPLTADAAKLWNTALGEETRREDEQLARKDAQTAALAQQLMLAQQRSEDTRLAIAQRKEAAEQASALKLQLAQMSADARVQVAGMVAGARADASADRAIARENRAADKAAEAKERVLQKLGENSKKTAPFMLSGQQVQDMLDKYGDKSIPGLGYVGKLPGVLLTKEGNLNRATVKSFVNAIMREHAGLSQTISEQANVNLETMADGNFTEKEFRKVWPFLRDRANSSMNNFRAGYAPDVITEFESRGGSLRNITPKTQSRGWQVEEVK